MDNLLQRDYIEYLNSLRPHVVQCTNVSISCVKSDVIDDTNFDIQDKKPAIKQSLGTGSVTYNNTNNKIIAVIDYEHFLNQQPNDVIKALDLKKCDFIVYQLDGKDFFILNELSQSGKASDKRKDAMLQLSNALMHFYRVPVIRSFIEEFIKKVCIFSNRTNPINTPDGIADSFGFVYSLLPQPISLNYHPITSKNFELIESSIINV